MPIYELRAPNGDLLAWLNPRPAHCDRGRFLAGFEVAFWKSENDANVRYYFDLERGKAEVEAYLRAKNVMVEGATWVTASY